MTFSRKPDMPIWKWGDRKEGERKSLNCGEIGSSSKDVASQCFFDIYLNGLSRLITNFKQLRDLHEDACISFTEIVNTIFCGKIVSEFMTINTYL